MTTYKSKLKKDTASSFLDVRKVKPVESANFFICDRLNNKRKRSVCNSKSGVRIPPLYIGKNNMK
jgi:hypothetical protein